MILKLNRPKEYVNRANKKAGNNGGVHYGGSAHLEREGNRNENPAVLDGGRSSVEEGEEFVEVDIQDLIDRGEAFEILLPDSEVAQCIVEMFSDTQVTMPSNVVTPSLRAELEKLGVPFKETDNQGKIIKKKGATSSSTVKKTQPIPNKGIRDVAKLRKDFVSAKNNKGANLKANHNRKCILVKWKPRHIIDTWVLWCRKIGQ